MSELKEDVILLLESYFKVLVWYGESAYGWKEQNFQDETLVRVFAGVFLNAYARCQRYRA